MDLQYLLTHCHVFVLRVLVNPCNTPTSNTPTVNYSASGPKDTPLGHAPIGMGRTDPPRGGGEEGIYHVLEAPKERGRGGGGGGGGGGADYAELEGEGVAYEVPISSNPPAELSWGEGAEYSALQHQ